MAIPPPRLPPELMDEVVAQAWNLRLSTSERVMLMVSLPLVSVGCFASYLRISSTYVHIPCPSYVDHYLRLLRQGALYYPTQRSKHYPVDLCRSITLEISHHSPPTCASHWEPAMGAALSELLYGLRLSGGLPSFRRLVLRYINIDPDDIFDWARFIDFPKSVQHLHLEVLQTEEKEAPPKFDITPPGYPPHTLLWTLPFLLHLRVSGSNEDFVSRLASTAPNLQSLQHVTQNRS